MIGASNACVSLFREFISAKNDCVRCLRLSTGSLLKDWDSSFILKASLILFRFEETYPIRNRVWFYRSLSIRNWESFLKNFSKNVFFNRILHLRNSFITHLIFCRFKVSIDAITKVSNFSCSLILGAFSVFFSAFCRIFHITVIR